MKKKLISGLISLVMLLSLLPMSITATAADENFQGEGTAESPYLISTAEDLTKLSSLTNAASTNEKYGAAHYKLTADIDMIGATFAGLNCMDTAWNYRYFTGVFDGDGHVIKNITISSTSNRARGFISVASGATVRNLGIENISIKGGAMGGIIAQDMGAKSTVENCYVRGLTATKNVSYETVAGIVGYAQSTDGSKTTITNCYAVGLSANSVRAIIGYDTANGYQSHGNLTNCYANLSDNVVGLGGTAVNCFASTTANGVTAEALGEAFKEDTKGKNGGYPLLSWETEANFEGEGTEENPYLLNDANDLVKLATLTNTTATAADYADKVYKLTADIDMTGISYKPVSWATSMYTVQGAAFTGTLDGNNHIIKNISFTNLATYGSTYGIIGFISANGVVKNLGVENMTVNGGAANRLCIGGIAGSLGAPVTIENCYVRGMSVTTTSTDATYVGGIAGRTIGTSGTIKNCYATGLDFTKVTREGLKAGILGSSGNVNYKAENCYTTDAKLQGNTAATNSYMVTTNCYASADLVNATVANLGDAFKENPTVKNEGYPLLSWESYEGYELKPKANLTLPDLISDHMLIQQNKPIKLWGNAEPGETVTVKLEAGNEIKAQVQTQVEETGRFDIELPKMTAGGPYALTFSTEDQSVTVSDVLIGELWVQSGQSNMARPTSGTGSYASEILPAEANDEIRIFMATADVSASTPATDITGSWKIADTTTVNNYSAVGYVALEKLNQELDMPVGGICNAVGGASMSQFMGIDNGTAGGYYYSKTAPLTQLNIRGVMWYQGEGDRGRTPSDFTATFNKLIRTWRNAWGDSDLPFVYVALPPSPMKYYASWTGGYIMEDFSSARLGQLQSYYENDNVAFAVAMDCHPNAGEDSLHPNNKKPIGERLGLATLDMIYNVIDNGMSPLFKSVTVNGNTATVFFNHTYGGLKTVDNEAPRCFYVSESENGTYYEAQAEITGTDEITLTCSEISEIKYVSYAVEKHMYPYTSADDAVINTYADVNLVNSENLPACPFAYSVSETRKEKAPKPFEIMNAVLSDDGKNVDVDIVVNEAKTSQVNLFIAFYNEFGRFVDVSVKPVSVKAAEGGVIYDSAEVPDGATSSKVMVMSDNLYPYLDASSVPLQK